MQQHVLYINLLSISLFALHENLVYGMQFSDYDLGHDEEYTEFDAFKMEDPGTYPPPEEEFWNGMKTDYSAYPEDEYYTIKIAPENFIRYDDGGYYTVQPGRLPDPPRNSQENQSKDF